MDFTLCVDFGSSYIRASLVAPNGSITRVKDVMDHIPAYVSFYGTDKTFIGRDSRDDSLIHLSHVFFHLKPLLSRPFQEARDYIKRFGLPFEIFADTDPSRPFFVLAADFQGNKRPISLLTLTKYLLAGIRALAKEQTTEADNITKCLIATTWDQCLYGRLFELEKVFMKMNLVSRVSVQAKALMKRDKDFGGPGSNLSRLFVRFGGSLCEILTAKDPEKIDKRCVHQIAWGGNDVDLLLVEYCIARFREVHPGRSPIKPGSFQRLRLNCENAKVQLTGAKVVTVEVNAFHEGHDLSIQLTADQFEDLCGPVCTNVVNEIQERVAPFLLICQGVFEVVLLGGGSKLPLLYDLVTRAIKKPQLTKSYGDDLVMNGLRDIVVEQQARGDPPVPSPRTKNPPKATSEQSGTSKGLETGTVLAPVAPTEADKNPMPKISDATLPKVPNGPGFAGLDPTGSAAVQFLQLPLRADGKLEPGTRPPKFPVKNSSRQLELKKPSDQSDGSSEVLDPCPFPANPSGGIPFSAAGRRPAPKPRERRESPAVPPATDDRALTDDKTTKT